MAGKSISESGRLFKSPVLEALTKTHIAFPLTIFYGTGVAALLITLFTLQQPVVTSVIVGAKRIDQLEDNIAATQVRLSAEDLQTLDAVSALPSEYPGWMLSRQGDARRAQIAAGAPGR